MTNIVTNPDFETNTTGWSATGTASIARSTATSHGGSACLEVNTGTDFLGVASSGLGTGDHNGETWRAYAWVKAKAAGDIGKEIAMLVIANNGGESQWATHTLTSDWRMVMVETVWPATTANLRVDFRANSGSATSFYVDDVVYEQVTEGQDTAFADAVKALSPSSYWKLRVGGFDEITSDSSAGVKTVGAPDVVASLVPSDGGLAGQALDLDGSADYFVGTDIYDFAGTATFSLMFVVRPDSLAAQQEILSKDPAWHVRLTTGGDLQMVRNEAENGVWESNLTAGEVALFVVTFDGAETIVYKNGVSLGTDTALDASITGTANLLTIGALASSGGDKFNGALQHVAVWSGTKLTSSQVNTLYNAFAAKSGVGIAGAVGGGASASVYVETGGGKVGAVGSGAAEENSPTLALQGSPVGADSVGSVSSLTSSVVVAAGSNRLLVVAVGAEGDGAGGGSITGVTYGGVALTRHTEQHGTAWAKAELWYLLNPTVGTADVVVSASPADFMSSVAYVFNNAHQTSPFRTAAGSTGTGESVSDTVAGAVSGDIVVDVTVVDGNHTLTHGANQTEQHDYTHGATTVGSSTQAGADGGVMSETWSGSNQYAHAATAVRPVSGDTSYVKTGGGVAGAVGSGADEYVTGANHLYEAASLKVICAATGDGARNTSGGSWVSGETYECTVWIKGTPGEAVKASVVKGGGNTLVGSEQSVTLVAGWQKISWEATATSSEAHKIQVVSDSGAQTFYLDGVCVYKQAVFSWATADSINGARSLSARLTDAQGNETTTAAISVTVDNPSPAFPTLTVEIAFQSAPRDYPQLWTDVTADFRAGEWGHGRSDTLDRYEAGTLSMILANHERKYDNANLSSPYAGRVEGGKRIRVTATYNGVSYQRWEGSIRDFKPIWTAGGRGAYVRVDAVDDFEPMNLGKISSPKASATIDPAGANNGLVFTSKFGGGNDISITYVDPGADNATTDTATETQMKWRPTWDGDDQYGGKGRGWPRNPHKPTTGSGPPPTLAVSGRKITVTLAKSGSSITSTAAQIKTAIEADADANLLVSVEHASGSSGAGVVTAMAETFLTGGERVAERSGSRIDWILDQLAVPEERRNVAAGEYDVQAIEMHRGSALGHAKEIEATELGQFFVASDGRVTFHDIATRATATVGYTYSDDPDAAAGEHLYVSVEPDSGTQFVRNDIEVTAPDIESVRVADSASDEKYWTQSYTHATLLTTRELLSERGDLLIATYKSPIPQITKMVVEPMREAIAYDNPTAWPAALSLEVSNLIAVERDLVLVGGGTLAYESFVESIHERVEAAEKLTWTIEVGLSIRDLSAT